MSDGYSAHALMMAQQQTQAGDFLGMAQHTYPPNPSFAAAQQAANMQQQAEAVEERPILALTRRLRDLSAGLEVEADELAEVTYRLTGDAAGVAEQPSSANVPPLAPGDIPALHQLVTLCERQTSRIRQARNKLQGA